jgi:lipopolysaccharide transport system permease protein
MTTAQAKPLASNFETVIRPPRRRVATGIRELWRYRELLYFLTKRELQVRYNQSVFGISWALLQPLALAGIFTLFFGRLAGIPSEGVPYPVFALAAIVPWLFIAQSVTQSASSLVGDSELLSKVYFPRLTLPLAKVLSLLVDLFIALIVVFVIVTLYGIDPQPTAPVIVLFLLLAMLTAVGVGTLLAAVNVKYRDVQVAVPLIVQIWLFTTPVVYPASFVTGAWQYLYALNPMVSVVEGARWALLGTAAPDLPLLLISVASALVVAAVAVTYFRRTEHFFADLI